MSFLSRLPLGTTRTRPDGELRLHPYLALASRYWAVVVIATLLGTLVGWGLSQAATQLFSSRATLYFSIGYGESGSDLNQGSAYAQSQMASFAELATTGRVLDAVVDDLDGTLTRAQVASMVDVTTPANTVVIDVTATSSDPQLAASVANATAQGLTDAVGDIAPRDESGKATVSVRTVENAAASSTPSSPNTRVNLVAGTVLGLVLGLLLIVARRLLDTRVSSTSAVGTAGALPVLARLRPEQDGVEDEDARRLAAVLQAVDAERTVGAAKTARRPRTFLVAGVVPGDAAEQLAERLSATAADGVTVTVVPDLSSSASALVLGRGSDGVVLVADTRHSHIGELRQAAEGLAAAGVRLIGTVLIDTPPHRTERAAAVAPTSRRTTPLAVLEHNEA